MIDSILVIIVLNSWCVFRSVYEWWKLGEGVQVGCLHCLVIAVRTCRLACSWTVESNVSGRTVILT